MANDLTLYEVVTESFNDKEKKVYEEIKKMLMDTTKKELLGRYQIAHKFYEIQQEAKNNKGYYGERFIERLATALGCSIALIREMIKVVAKYPTKEEFSDYVSKLESPRWKDLVLLARVDDPIIEEKLIEKMNEKVPLSLIQEELKEKNMGKRGRKPKIPTTAKEFLNDVLSKTTSWERKITNSWHDFDSVLLETIPKDQIAQYLDLLNECNNSIMNLEGSIIDLKSVLSTIKTKLIDKSNSSDDNQNTENNNKADSDQSDDNYNEKPDKDNNSIMDNLTEEGEEYDGGDTNYNAEEEVEVNEEEGLSLSDETEMSDEDILEELFGNKDP